VKKTGMIVEIAKPTAASNADAAATADAAKKSQEARAEGLAWVAATVRTGLG